MTDRDRNIARSLQARLEEIYFHTNLGAALRHVAGHVAGATLRFDAHSGSRSRCRIEVELDTRSIEIEGFGEARSSAFARAVEVLERRLFSEIHGGASDWDGSPSGDLLLAA